ncbi:Protein of unknown function [Halobacillus karajensis]|uniref:DUF2975 domain-containing protein n=1 Tax=Halobacillus karajensis TaxID=195088 RepID=UPI00045C36A5|nr:DUF2975 domain-containing protein [Halobacillus karajensis]CDQ20096.1 hypothetical protein BN982_02411 [Halobacillus karajensis]CDQ28398.1 hypothetical protein BN981_02698 [Halobacillus karajensis]SEI00540.1 Protein of unknown function [Halobacillus karajensis]
MKHGTTLFLKVAVILLGLPILALCLFFVPGMADYAAEIFTDFPLIEALVLIYVYGTTIPFYFALYQAYQLLSFIDKNKAFSDLSVKALKRIKHCALIISILYVIFMPLIYILAEVDDAPGLILIGMFIIFASTVIAVFAAVLQRLLQEAIHIKSENDLTV